MDFPTNILWNINWLAINMKAICRASIIKSREQANERNNSGITEEVFVLVRLIMRTTVLVAVFSPTIATAAPQMISPAQPETGKTGHQGRFFAHISSGL